MRGVVLAALLAATQVASAAPHRARAKADFERGVKAYQKADYAAAADAFKRSFAAESDVETLFAWAQAERQQDHCELAIELYRKLDGFVLPAKNREVVVAKREECQAMLDAQHPRPEPVVEPKHPPHRTPKPEPEPDAVPESVPGPIREPIPEVVPAEPPPPPPSGRHATPGHPWYRDPAGDAFVGAGAVSLGVGVSYLVGSYHASVTTSHTADEFAANHARADRDGKLGVGFSAAGALLLAAGLVRYSMLHPSDTTLVTAWTTPTSGGVTLLGRF